MKTGRRENGAHAVPYRISSRDQNGILWDFVGEGARNVIFRYKGENRALFRRVIRVTKEIDSDRIEKGTGAVSSDWSAYNLAFRSYLGDNVTCAMRRANVDQGFLTSLRDVLLRSKQLRHPKRRHLSVDTSQKQVIEMPDYTFFRSHESTTDMDAAIHWSVELKPKSGILPSSPFVSRGIKRRVSRFTLHQPVKMRKKKVKRISRYEALDLFEYAGSAKDSPAQIKRCQDGIRRVLERLAETPQNNLRLFRDGRKIYAEKVVADDAAINKAKLDDLTGPLGGSRTLFNIVSSALVESKVLRKIRHAQETLNPFDIEMVHAIYRWCLGVLVTGEKKGSDEGGRDQMCAVFDPFIPLDSLECVRRRGGHTSPSISNRIGTLSIALTLREGIEVVRRYLLWKSFCDVSIFITFRQNGASFDDAEVVVEGKTRPDRRFDTQVTVVDIDLKSHERITHYWKMDEEIVEHCEDPSQVLNICHMFYAHEVVDMLKRKIVSPRSLVEIVERRVNKSNAAIRAVTTTCFERARTAPVLTSSASSTLRGIPVLVKDLQDVEGVLTTCGSSILARNVAMKNGPAVAALVASGGIVVGKTNTPEFGAGSQTFNSIFPTTTSPWCTAKTAGGSSGGSASALAACAAWLATGSDLGGSLRNPAAFCGIVGFRPSPGRVPRDSTFARSGPPHNLHSTNGPMARCVRDVALFLDAMAPISRDLSTKVTGWDFPAPERICPPDVLVGSAALRREFLNDASSKNCGRNEKEWVRSWEEAAICGAKQGARFAAHAAIRVHRDVEKDTVGKAFSLLASSSDEGSIRISREKKVVDVVHSVRVGFSVLGCDCDPEVVRIARNAARKLALAISFLSSDTTTSFASFVECPRPFDVERAWRIFCRLRASKFGKSFGSLLKSNSTLRQLKPEIVWNTKEARRAMAGGGYSVANALEDAKRLLEEVRQFFDTTNCCSSSSSECEKSDHVSLLCTPATMCVPFDRSVRYPAVCHFGSNQRFSNYLEWMKISCVVSSTQCPALVLPCGRLPDGRPVGLQIIAGPGADATVLAAAALLESVLLQSSPSVRRLLAGCREPRDVEPSDVPPDLVDGPRTRESALRHHEGGVWKTGGET